MTETFDSRLQEGTQARWGGSAAYAEYAARDPTALCKKACGLPANVIQ